MPRGPGGPHHHQTWPEETTAEEVVGWAAKQLFPGLGMFVAGARERDAEKMRLGVKALRAVVTRMEQFARQEWIRWRVQQGSSQSR